MPDTPSLSIPFEIIFDTIDMISFSEDIASLRSISQTCKGLCRYSRRKLFNAIEINCDKDNSEEEIDRLFELLTREGNEELASHVERFSYTPVAGHAEIGIVLSIISRLSKVRDLELSSTYADGNLFWNTLPDRLRNALRGMLSLPSHEKLKISYIVRFPLSELWGCISLKYLDLEACEFIPGSLSSPSCRQILPRLLHLSTERDYNSNILNALLGHDIGFDDGTDRISRAFDFSGLKILSVFVASEDDWAKALKIIDTSRNNLENLLIDFEPPSTTLAGLVECITYADGVPNLTSSKFVIPAVDVLGFHHQLQEERSALDSAKAKHALRSKSAVAYTIRKREEI